MICIIKKNVPELTIALTKDDFTLNEAAEAYVYRKDGMMDSDLFKKAVISIHGMLDRIENPELILDNMDFNLDDKGSYQVFYPKSLDFLVYITNGFSITDDPDQAPPDTSNSRDFVEVCIPQFMFEDLDSLSIKIGFIDEKLIPEWCVDLSSFYDYTDQIHDKLDSDIDSIRSEVTDIQNNIRMAIVTTTGTSSAYKVTTPDDIGTKIGDLLVVIPHVTSTSAHATLTVNNGKPMYVYMYHLGLSGGYMGLTAKNWFCNGIPYILLYNGSNFLVVGSPSFDNTGVVNFGYCSDSGDATTKTAYLNRSYIGDNASGGIFGIVFTNDNTATNPKLLIYGNGSPVWYGEYCDIVTSDGAPILPTMIKAGKLYLFAFAGNSYQFFSTTKTGLEKKYILLNPDSDPKLPSPTTAQVGQIISVKSVDESGKITETETVDIPNRLDVTVSMGDNGFVVSHKFAEIKAAYDAGRAVQLIDTDTSRKYSLMNFYSGSSEGITDADFRFIDGAGDIWKATINSNDEIDFFQEGTFITLYGDIPQDTPKAITYSVVNGIGYADFIPYIEIPSTGDELKERLMISPAYFYVMPNAYAPFVLKNLVNPYTLTRLSYSEPEFGTEDNTYEASYLVTDSLGQQIKATCQVLLTESGLGDLVWNFEVRDSLIVKSSTEGSTKKFKITVDDSGTISAIEITETPA